MKPSITEREIAELCTKHIGIHYTDMSAITGWKSPLCCRACGSHVRWPCLIIRLVQRIRTLEAAMRPAMNLEEEAHA